MKKLLIVIAVLIGLPALLALLASGSYNALVSKQQAVDASWAQVANQYQRRADLVPNLVKTVQGSADFEKSTLESVTNARASVGKITIDASKAPESAAGCRRWQRLVAYEAQ